MTCAILFYVGLVAVIDCFDHVEVRLLTMAVDELISVDDFLAVSEAHIIEDVKIGIQVASVFFYLIIF